MMHFQHQSLEQTPHIAPALTAVILGVIAMTAMGLYARSLEYRSITALAADEAIFEREGKLSAVKNLGTALQQAALDTEGLLPVYGSSELNLQTTYNRPFHATTLFHDRPTGFTVFPVGKAATTCLIILQKLAAVGPALKGRKVALSVSPFWFFERLTARPDGYANNFSALHAGELAFNTRLSLQLRQDAARRMLQYPATLGKRPFLRFVLESLADGSPLSLACYQAVRPLGLAHNALLRNLDHWRVVHYLWMHPTRAPSLNSPNSGRPPDWALLYRQAETLYSEHSNNNEFRIDNDLWDRRLHTEMDRKRHSRSDEAFLRTLKNSQEWIDLEILLRELTELGAQTLVMSMPINGGWYDECGITYTARKAYYQKLRETCARHHTPVVDFADHDADQSFCHDDLGHLAPRGLVYYSQVFNDFFHDAIPSQPEVPATAAVAKRATGADLLSRPAPGSRLPPKVSTNPPSRRQ